MNHNKNNIEVRNISNWQFRDAGNGQHTVSGTAIVFDTPSPNRDGWVEIISKGAITNELLNKSDVLLTINHDDNRMIARCKQGQGSLKLTLTDKTLDFETTLPNTEDGKYVYEMNKRGDLTDCSFAFAVDPSDESAETWERASDGTIYRRINKIAILHDVSVVVEGYYTEPSFSTRSIDKFNELKNIMTKEEIDAKIKALQEQRDAMDKPKPEDKPKEGEQPKPEDKPKEGEQPKSDDESKPDDKPKEEKGCNYKPKEEDKSADEKNKDDKTSNDEQKEDKKSADESMKDKEDTKNKEDKNTRSLIHNVMEKRNFNLIKAIREASNKNFDETAQAINKAGAAEMRKAGIAYSQNDIVLPLETRDGEFTFATAEDDVVAVDLQPIVKPLTAAMVNNALGISVLTGLSHEVKIPIGKSVTAGWAKELAKAAQQTPSFESLTLKPYRLSAYVDISNEMLAMDSIGVQNYIVDQLGVAIAQKLESTMWSDSAAVENEQPAGLLNGLTAANVTDYTALADFEAGLDKNNIDGDRKYLLSPKAKAAIRVMTRGGDHTQNVLEGNEIDGTPFVQTSNVADSKFVYGDFKSVVLAQFGALKITVDNVSLAVNDTTRITITMYVDFAKTRKEALALGNVASTATPSTGE